MKNHLSLPLFLCFLVLTPAIFLTPVWSQDKPADNMQLLREKMEADKKLLVAQNLQLTEAESGRFWPVYERFQQDLDKHADRTRKLIGTYAANYASIDDATAKNLLDEYLAIQSDQVKLLQSFLPKFRQALPERKVARYYQIENKLDAVMTYELARRIPLVP